MKFFFQLSKHKLIIVFVLLIAGSPILFILGGHLWFVIINVAFYFIDIGNIFEPIVLVPSILAFLGMIVAWIFTISIAVLVMSIIILICYVMSCSVVWLFDFFFHRGEGFFV